MMGKVERNLYGQQKSEKAKAIRGAENQKRKECGLLTLHLTLHGVS